MAVIQGLLILFTSLTFGTEYTRFLFSGGIDSLNSAMPVIFGDLIILIFIPSLYIASKLLKIDHFLLIHLHEVDGTLNSI